MMILTTLVIAVALTLSAADAIPARTEIRELRAGGKVDVDVRAGDVTILRGLDSQHVKVTYRAQKNHCNAADRVAFRFEVTGSEASIKLRSPNGVNLNTVIEVPGVVNLTVHLLAGDLRVEGIEGDKTLQTRFGDITVVDSTVQYKQLYKRVDASTRAGDVEGLLFDGSRGWVGKSGELSGSGTFLLNAHATFGDIRFLTVK